MSSSLHLINSELSKYSGDTLSFLIGEPYYSPPEALVNALSEAARHDSHRYSEAGGLPALKKMICEIERDRGLEIEPDNIVIGNGAKGLLYGLHHCLQKSKVLVPVPSYPANLNQPKGAGHEVITVQTSPPGFIFDPAEFHQKPVDVGAIILVSPSNPAGTSYSESEQDRLSSWCGSNRVLLIADETYIDLAFNDDFSSFGAVDKSVNQTAIIRSFSKSLGICGWRMGYIVASRRICDALTKWQSGALNPPSKLIQNALLKYLPVDESWLAEKRAYYHELARNISSTMEKAGFQVAVADGGFYLFCNAENILDRSSFHDDLSLCTNFASKAGIALWPGVDFGYPGWVRLSFGAIAPTEQDKVIKLLISRLAENKSIYS